MRVQVVATERYMMASEQHAFLRVIPHLLYLLDGEDESANAFKNRKIDLSVRACVLCFALIAGHTKDV